MSARRSDVLWVDLGDVGAFVHGAGPFERWQDHGLGLLRTILHREGIETDIASARGVATIEDLAPALSDRRLLLMNVRSYTYPIAVQVTRLFRRSNPAGRVIVGGMHATVAPAEMEEVPEFDHICVGAGEEIVVDLVRDPEAFPRTVLGRGARSMEDWPRIDRELWPRPDLPDYPWPLEPECGWGPGPVATILTSRVCPWRCSFCNEASYIDSMPRRSPESVVDELNWLDRHYGVGSVVIHDSMFFQNRRWLVEWLETYPSRARRRWPYWAAARSDMVRRWPDLFEALVTETGWNTVSIGFESGSDRVLRILNKECTAADNRFAIDLLNRIGDEAVAADREPPKFWANIMLGVPGERREDALETMRMVRAMRYRQLSPALYAPYPGSALGFQLIGEGRSLLTEDNYHRYPEDEKVAGVDYDLCRALLAGELDDEVASREWSATAAAAAPPTAAHRFYLFDLVDGGHKLLYGSSPEDALAVLEERAGAQERARVLGDSHRIVKQRDLLDVVGGLA